MVLTRGYLRLWGLAKKGPLKGFLRLPTVDEIINPGPILGFLKEICKVSYMGLYKVATLLMI